jgi:hypothetical protein
MANQPFVEDDTDNRWRATLAPWAQEVVERSQELGDLLEHVDSGHRDRLAELLDAAQRLAFERIPLWRGMKRMNDWWYGSRVERAWSLIHQAELFFVEYSDDRGFEIALDNALGYAGSLPKTDPVRVRFEEYVQSLAEASTNGDKPAATAPSRSSAAPASPSMTASSSTVTETAS